MPDQHNQMTINLQDIIKKESKESMITQIKNFQLTMG